MAVPNIESIAASLKNCSLSSVRGAEPKQELTVELNQDKTGKLFYVNWNRGERKTEFSIPSSVSSCSPASYYSSEETNSEDCEEIEGEEENDGDVEDLNSLVGSGSDYEDFFCVNSRNSYISSSPVSEAENNDASGIILVVAGCKSCFIYFMVPKGVEVCPKCGGFLLHFD